MARCCPNSQQDLQALLTSAVEKLFLLDKSVVVCLGVTLRELDILV